MRNKSLHTLFYKKILIQKFCINFSESLYIYMYTYIYIYKYIYVYTNIYMYIQIYICIIYEIIVFLISLKRN